MCISFTIKYDFYNLGRKSNNKYKLRLYCKVTKRRVDSAPKASLVLSAVSIEHLQLVTDSQKDTRPS